MTVWASQGPNWASNLARVGQPNVGPPYSVTWGLCGPEWAHWLGWNWVLTGAKCGCSGHFHQIIGHNWAQFCLFLGWHMAQIGLTDWAGIGYKLGTNAAVLFISTDHWPQLGSVLAVLGVAYGPWLSLLIGLELGSNWGQRWLFCWFHQIHWPQLGPVLAVLGVTHGSSWAR